MKHRLLNYRLTKGGRDRSFLVFGLSMSLFLHVLEPINSMVDAGSAASFEGQMSEKLLKSVDHLDLTVRSYNCLRSAGITTVWDLVQMRDSDLLRLPNFGKKSLREISEILGKMDFSLGMSIPQSVS